jgi:plasmid stability protein
MFGLDPLTIGVIATVVIALRNKSDKLYGVLTPERDEAYQQAMKHCSDSDVLLETAKLYENHGLKVHGKMLKKRAAWHARSPEKKAEQQTIYEAAMACDDVANKDAMLEIALLFERLTASHKAANIRQKVAQLEAAAQEAAKPKPAPVVETEVKTDAAAPKAKKSRVAITEKPVPAKVNGAAAHDEDEEIVSESVPAQAAK